MVPLKGYICQYHQEAFWAAGESSALVVLAIHMMLLAIVGILCFLDMHNLLAVARCPDNIQLLSISIE